MLINYYFIENISVSTKNSRISSAIWYQTLKNGVLTVGQDAVLTS